MMIIGACQAEIMIPGAFSLKDKRSVLKSLERKIRNRFNVSVAETDHQDKWQMAELGISMVSSNREIMEKTFHKIIEMIEAKGEAEIGHFNIEFL